MISKTALQAVRALAFLGQVPEGQFAGTGTIAEQIHAKPNYLGKLLQLLTHQGLVVSQKGLGGGFRLARQPDRITLLDIVEPIDHVARWTGCFLGNPTCSEETPCAMHHQWSEVRAAYIRLLEETRVSDLIPGH